MKNIIKTLHNLSIRQKFMAVVMLTSTTTLIMTFAGFGWYNILNLRENANQQLHLLAEVIGNRSNACLVYYDEEVCAENLAAFNVKPAITAACIYDAVGFVFATYYPENSKDKCPGNSLQQPHKKDGRISFMKDIFLDEDKVGSLYVESDLTEIHENIKKYLIYVIVFIIAGSVLAYAISKWLLKLVTKPIFSLVTTAQAVSENHNYTVRAKKSFDDELGVLVDAFNEMLFEIQKRDRQITASKENLELKVVERTRDLERAKEEAERANRTKSDFLANMSHELRTPMHAVLSYANFGIDENKTASKEDVLSYFTRIRDSGRRLLSLLNNLLDLSKLEAGKMDFQLQKADLQSPLRQVSTEISKLLEEKKLTLNIITPSHSTKAFFDHERIVQVIYNLLSNAIKFSPEHCDISVFFSNDEVKLSNGKTLPALLMSVSDEGNGIPDGEVETIFNKFIQSSKTHSGAGGTGLGLAICREILLEHHGEIWCKNNDKEGATFTFAIPTEFVKIDEKNSNNQEEEAQWQV